MFSPGLLDGNPPPRWGAPGEDQIDSNNAIDKRGSLECISSASVGIGT